MPLPVPIDRGVHTTRTALPDCARTREYANVRRNFRQSTRSDGGGAAQTANSTQSTYNRSETGGLQGGGGDDTRSSSGHLISCHFQFRRLEIPPRTRANPEPSVAGGGNNLIYTNFKQWCRDASFPVYMNGRAYKLFNNTQ